MKTLWGAIRRVWQRPTFAAAATATRALGIAAPTALFAVLYATLRVAVAPAATLPSARRAATTNPAASL
jgi:hypothetical protein